MKNVCTESTINQTSIEITNKNIKIIRKKSSNKFILSIFNSNCVTIVNYKIFSPNFSTNMTNIYPLFIIRPGNSLLNFKIRLRWIFEYKTSYTLQSKVKSQKQLVWAVMTLVAAFFSSANHNNSTSLSKLKIEATNVKQAKKFGA